MAAGVKALAIGCNRQSKSEENEHHNGGEKLGVAAWRQWRQRIEISKRQRRRRHQRSIEENGWRRNGSSRKKMKIGLSEMAAEAWLNRQ